ncbi:nitroreductase family protein [candidate division KSB1 bacterium]
MRSRQFSILFSFFLILTANSIFAQKSIETFKFTDTDKWILPFTGTEIIEYNGKEAFRLKEGNGERIAYLKDIEFENGIIELDIAAIPSFIGLAFRIRSENIYEAVYFRPQNSGHSNPVRRGHTVQYISNPRHTWYYLREKYPEKYESHADIAPGKWFHLKIEVNGTEAKVFVNNSRTPCLVVSDLKHGLSKGSIGVWCGNGSAGTFANLKVKPLPDTGSTNLPRSEKVEFTPEQKYLFNVFKTRRSVRKFKPTTVPPEHLMKILDIARSGPTSGNQQPWKFLVIQDREKLDKLRDDCINRSIQNAKRRGAKTEALEQARRRAETYYANYLSAPVYVVVLVDSNSKYPSYNIYDGAIAGSYLMIAARALGYGTVFSQDSIPYDLIKKIFEIPDNFERICFTPIGVPEEWPATPRKKPLDESAVFEKLIQGVNFEIPVTKKEIKLNPKILEQYRGEYEFNENLKISVTTENSRIFVQMSGQPKTEIFAETENKFFPKVVEADITFVKGPDSKVTGLVLKQGTVEMKAKKIK